MPAPFGFGIGDFIAVLQLVAILIDVLGKSSNTGTSFQGLLNELYALEAALLQVKRIDLKRYGIVRVTSLRQAASQCQHTIDEFWKKVQKYQPHLQHGGTNSKVKDTWYRVKWALCKEADLEKFRAEIRGHTGSLEILLSTMQLEAMTLHSHKMDSRHTNLADMIQEQISNVMKKLTVITATGCGHQEGSKLLEISTQILQSNLRTFQAIRDIQLSILGLPGQIRRQQPVYLIDALNRECPFHLEFVRSSKGLFDVLKENLKETGCGPDMVDRGQFVIEEQGTRRQIDFTRPWESCLHPGQKIDMSMVFTAHGLLSQSCPSCGTRCEESIQETVW
jgi:hypothetical protein